MMVDDHTQTAQNVQDHTKTETSIATQTDQSMAEHLLLETLPKAKSDTEGTEQSAPGEWPEHLQHELDLVVLSTFLSAGVISLFLWMGGLF